MVEATDPSQAVLLDLQAREGKDLPIVREKETGSDRPLFALPSELLSVGEVHGPRALPILCPAIPSCAKSVGILIRWTIPRSLVPAASARKEIARCIGKCSPAAASLEIAKTNDGASIPHSPRPELLECGTSRNPSR